MSQLVKRTLEALNLSTRFNIVESKEHNGLGRTLYHYLHHLCEPSDTMGHGDTVNEVTIVGPDANKKSAPGTVKATPKIDLMTRKASEEGLGGKLHKQIHEGFKKSFETMDTEDHKTYHANLKASKAVFNTFAKSRGLKAAPSLLHGNMKTEKSSGEGVLTTGLHLAPHSLGGMKGFDVCPKASTECKANCLGTTAGGNRIFHDNALSSKMLRTQFVAKHPEHAARIIDHEITQHKAQAKKKGMLPGVRLNVTSDLSWEHHAPKLFERHKDVQFYDYTKLPNRVVKSIHPAKGNDHFNEHGHPKNYHLTLSHTGTGHAESNDKDTLNVLHKGGVSAMVFQKNKEGKLPTHVEDVATGKRYPVTHGDHDDNTFDRHATLGKTHGKEGHGVVSGLMLKGVKNEAAGHFANKVDPDGIARINHPKV